jgi:copper transport protein
MCILKGGGVMRLAALFLAILLVGVAFGARSSNAYAHSQYIRSQPEQNAVLAQAPFEVLVWFTEATELQFSEMQVVDATGARVDNNDLHHHGDTSNPGITLQPNLPQGTYTVIWRMLSAVDGHRTAGTFAFSVGQPSAPPAPGSAPLTIDSGGSGPPTWLAALNRWVGFAGMAAFLGAIMFPALVLPAGLRSLKPDEETKERIAEKVARIVRLTIISSLVVVSITTLLSLWFQGWSAGGSATSVTAIKDVWTDTRFGQVWTLRVSVLIGAFLLGFLAFGRLKDLIVKGDWRESSWISLAICAVALPLTTSLNSHAAAERSQTEFRVIVDWMHLVTGGVWIGGLLQLALITPAVLSITEKRPGFLAGVIPRFSQVALVAVGLVVVTGSIQWWHRLHGITAAFDSDYGYMLVVKVLLLAPLLLLAAFNLLIVRPRFLSFVVRGAKAASARIVAWERRFRWAVAGELAVAIVILGVTALLTETSTPTPGSAATNSSTTASTAPTPSGLAQSVKADDLDISLDVYPGKAGPNELGIFLADSNGDERAVQNVFVRYKYLDQSLGQNQDTAEAFHPPTHYIVNTSQLSLAGKWQLEIIVRREGLLDARADFTVQVAA